MSFGWRQRLAPALAALALLPAGVDAAKWRVMEDCTLIDDPSNDGDSFHVRWHKRHYIFRLYFVDTPESEDSLPERVAEQAAYFGIDSASSIQLGKEAKKFTAKFLEEGFSIQTMREDARGRSDRERFYGIVKNKAGEDLAESLVANGLARIFGVDKDVPEEVRSSTFNRRLKGLELQAKNQKLGGWAPNLTRVEQRLAGLAAPVDVVGQTITTPQTVAVFSLEDASRQLGLLQRGAQVKIVEALTPGMLKIQITTGSGAVIEGQCRRADLGI
ncbi:MAG TPA: thermonuclease family protein [Kiritimatiellia bacterium]|nr:thermonuclease family protein [Kiritimatiellia bacterium]HRZ11543.1 thermonuclease family protein [Kiritimatiellia bacterium]HSA16906.1 thermonuclease family protein [Kiritimatiellia bacterium]